MSFTRDESESEKKSDYYKDTKQTLTEIDKKIVAAEAKKNHYYVKFSFIEEIFIVPQCGGGAVLSILDKPGILEEKELPKDIKVNTNITKKKSSSEEKFDYFYDCGEMDIRDVKRALNLFMLSYTSDITEPTDGEENPFLLKFEKALTKAKFKPIGLFSGSDKSKSGIECLEPLTPVNNDREDLICRIVC